MPIARGDAGGWGVRRAGPAGITVDRERRGIHAARMLIPRQAKGLHYEDIPTPAGASLVVREFGWPHFPFNWHYHPEVELTLIVRGSGRRFVGDSVEEFRHGDLCLLGSDTPHCWASHPGSPPGVKSLVIQFLPRVWGDAFWELPEARGLGGLLARAKAGLAVRGRTRRSVGGMMLEMTKASPGSWRRLQLMLGMLGTVADSGETVPLAHAGYDPAPGHRAALPLGRVLEFIHHNLAGELTQHGAAAVAGMSAQHFSQFFRRAMGKTYVTYVNELRIRNACRALIESEQTVAEVAYASGFNNLSHFNTQFRRFEKTNPKDFRQAARKGVSRQDLGSPEDWLGAFR